MFGFDVRAAKVTWTVFLVALLLFVAYLVSSTLLVVVFAVFFSYLLYPLVELADRFRPRRVSRTLSIGAVFLLVIALVVVAGTLFGTRIEQQASSLSQQLPALLKSGSLIDRIPLPDFMEPLRARILAFLQGQMAAGTDQAMPFAKQFGAGVLHAAGNLIYLVLVPVLSFLLIKEAPAMRVGLLAMLKPGQRGLWSGIIADLDLLLSRYVRAVLILSIATFIAYSIAFSLLGVEYSLLLAGVAAVLEFIPFAGPLAAAALALLVAGFTGYDHMLWLLMFIAAYRLVQDYVINPYLMSEGVEVSPLMVIIGLLAGEQLGGVAGIFLSVPVMAAARLVFLRLREVRAAEAVPVPAPVRNVGEGVG
ncbi:Predicted PurR-regulated permease PerM [Duganella sp. CF517]|uniref:AI-2E family transporter n=1 Tax=Duganella sp. CF517 TaxID=1881038 RepID=UPI0008C53A0C|nr:AI-2E family transporter [Duganella sp. CF517]SEO00834.1 Predicted PurR-regulated permease PerM [Duganella sp. CF517]